MADPTRREILALLVGRGRGYVSVSWIHEHFECISQPTLSYHLHVLREAGLVGSYREGSVARYGIQRRMLDEFLNHVFDTYCEPLPPRL